MISLQLLHKCCNMDMLVVLLIYPHSPSDGVYISVKPLTAVLQHIIIRQHTHVLPSAGRPPYTSSKIIV